VSPDAKEVLYNVLLAAILDMRSASEVGRDDTDREFVNHLAHLVHTGR
jgi:hypothetical protein